MKSSALSIFTVIGIVIAGISAAAQNAPEQYTAPTQENYEPAQQSNMEPSAPIDAPEPNPIYSPNQDTSWAPAPEIIMDIPIEQEFISDAPKAKTKKPSLANGGAESEYQIDWSAIDAQSQAAIAQTQHRKREIDPRKRANLSALSRVFGSLHALRISCQGMADQTYRARMSSMLDMEAPAADYIRDPLIGAFNSGFSEGGGGQRSCPTDHEIKEALLAKSGYSLSKLMVEYYKTNP